MATTGLAIWDNINAKTLFWPNRDDSNYDDVLTGDIMVMNEGSSGIIYTTSDNIFTNGTCELTWYAYSGTGNSKCQVYLGMRVDPVAETGYFFGAQENAGATSQFDPVIKKGWPESLVDLDTPASGLAVQAGVAGTDKWRMLCTINGTSLSMEVFKNDVSVGTHSGTDNDNSSAGRIAIMREHRNVDATEFGPRSTLLANNFLADQT